MTYLPDTNIVIRALQGHEPEANFLKRAIQNNEVVISVIVIAEFYVNPQPTEIPPFELLVDQLPVLPIDVAVARQAGQYRNQFLRKIKRVFLQDCFLAAQAKIHHLTLVTNNRTDFPMRDIKVMSP